MSGAFAPDRLPSAPRRRLLRAGFGGGVLLALSGWVGAAAARAGHAGSSGPFPLPDGERAMLAAMASVLLDGMLPTDAAARRASVERTVEGVARTVAGLSPSMRKEVAELFGLLAPAPGRRLLAGVGADWREADPAEVAAFLARWRNSRFALLFSGYAALHDLVLGAWYAQPDAWEAIGYPGPPEIFR